MAATTLGCERPRNQDTAATNSATRRPGSTLSRQRSATRRRIGCNSAVLGATCRAVPAQRLSAARAAPGALQASSTAEVRPDGFLSSQRSACDRAAIHSPPVEPASLATIRNFAALAMNDALAKTSASSSNPSMAATLIRGPFPGQRTKFFMHLASRSSHPGG
ncbi:unnamed protein product, partial [Prorocentrum cordatum]